MRVTGRRVILAGTGLMVALGLTAFAADDVPRWAFVVTAPPAPGSTTDTSLQHVPGSTIGLTRAQIGDLTKAVDWHPEDHTPMPTAVALATAQGSAACGYCHLPTGAGRPENASLAGLPDSYISAQMKAFSDGTRRSSVDHAPGGFMIQIARKASPADVEAAAKYFSIQKPRNYIRVVETQTVPKTEAVAFSLRTQAAGGTEPIGERIIEISDSSDQFELRDSRVTFTAYVPVGSVALGKALSTNGANACTSCHGPNLRGQGDAPRLAGRSPSYIVRQLFDFQSGARNDPGAGLMKPIANSLSAADRVNVAAYLATLRP